MERKIIIITLLCLLPQFSWAAKKSLSICYEDTSNPPLYYSIDQAQPGLPGLTVELLQQAAKSNGLELKLLQIPWKRCLKALATNIVDGAFDLSYKAQREEFAVYPYANGVVDNKRYLHVLAYYLFTLKSSKIKWDGKSLHNLSGKLVGVSGYSIIDDLRSDGYVIGEGKNQLSNMEMLARGRVEAVAQFATTTQNIIDSDPDKYRDVIQHKQPLRRKLYYLAFGKEFYASYPVLAESVWNSLAELNEAGFARKNSAKYADKPE